MSNTLDEILNTYESNLRHAYETSKTGTFPTVDAKQQIQALITEANKAGYRKGYEHCLVGKAPIEQLKENK